MSQQPDIQAVKDYLIGLQERICQRLETVDGQASFIRDSWQRPEGGGGISRVLADGGVIEKGGVNFSHVMGETMPASATAHRPHLAGAPWQAMGGVSLVIHPNNPYVPTSHANVRFFIATPEDSAPVYWFGGGYDLTPYYGFEEDCVHWHRTAKAACQPFGDSVYADYKRWCDDYFYLKHRQEPRGGVGGLFFDDYNTGDFDRDFAFMQAVGDSYIEPTSRLCAGVWISWGGNGSGNSSSTAGGAAMSSLTWCTTGGARCLDCSRAAGPSLS